MVVQEGEDTQTKGIENLFNNITQSWEREGHPGTKELQNSKLSGPEKKKPQTYNQNTQYTEQRKHAESCKREMTGHI
jgi:hypothetical protein